MTNFRVAMCAALALATCLVRPTRAGELTGAGWCFQYALVNWNPHIRLAPVMDGISVDIARNAATLDTVAEMLVRRVDDEQFDKEDVKLLAGLLVRTQSGRYRQVMEKVRASKRFAVVRDLARDYIERNRRSTADQYVPGTIDFEKLREQYISAALAVKPTEERAHQLASLTRAQTIDDLFTLLGPPQSVTTGYFRNSETLKFRRLMLAYRGAGRAVFALDDKEGWIFQSTTIDPLAFESQMPYRARAVEFGLPEDHALRMAQLTGQGVVSMKIAIQEAYELPQVPLEFLDTAAEILARDWHSPRADSAEDYYEWTIKLLAAKGGPRYTPLLQTVARAINFRNRVAHNPVKLAPGVPRTAYVPGSTDLAAQARKYPSPYPGVIYTSERL